MKKILIIQNKRIGDVLLSSVIANNIKLVFPDSEVTFFTYHYPKAVLLNNPNIDKIISVDDKELKKVKNLVLQIIEIRKHKYDIIFDPYSKFQSRIMCLFSKAPFRIGFKRKHKTLKLPFYTHPVNFSDHTPLNCGSAIADRVRIISSVFPLENPNYVPKIFLTETEKNYKLPDTIKKPVIMMGILGSTPQKSMPYDYMVALINFITTHVNATILFNYAPHQKDEALKIYNACTHKDQIDINFYKPDIREFIVVLNQCNLLIANEGGIVHMVKALNKPTFTIYSPYILKAHWASFEDGNLHRSIHILEEQPNLISVERKDTKKVEKNPEFFYRELTPEMIIKKLKPFLETHLKDFIK